MLLLDLPGQRLVLLRCCRHLPFFQTVVEAVDLRDRLEDRVSVLRRHGIEFPDAALAVHFFGRTQIGVQLAQRGGSGIFVSVHRVQIATGTTPGSGCTSCFVSAHRVQIATCFSPLSLGGIFFVSAHRVQIATYPKSRADTNIKLCLSAPRADRNSGDATFTTRSGSLSQRTACRSQRQMCTKHRVRICGMRCESVDSFSQHEDLLRADYFPELFCYQSSLCCH